MAEIKTKKNSFEKAKDFWFDLSTWGKVAIGFGILALLFLIIGCAMMGTTDNGVNAFNSATAFNGAHNSSLHTIAKYVKDLKNTGIPVPSIFKTWLVGALFLQLLLPITAIITICLGIKAYFVTRRN